MGDLASRPASELFADSRRNEKTKRYPKGLLGEGLGGEDTFCLIHSQDPKPTPRPMLGPTPSSSSSMDIRAISGLADSSLAARADKANLDAEIFDFGAALLHQEGISLRGVSKEASAIFKATGNKTAFDALAGWSDDFQDPGITGGPTLVAGSWKNKQSYLTNLFKYARAMGASPPFSLQLIYSSCLYYAASEDSTMRATYFNSLVLDLVALNLVIEKPSFSFVRHEYATRLAHLETTNAPGFQEPFTGLTPDNVHKILYDQNLGYMLHLWERTAVRWHTIQYIRLKHLNIITFDHQKVLLVRFWSDKVAARHGRYVLLTCSCATPIGHAKLQSVAEEVLLHPDFPGNEFNKRPCLVHAYSTSTDRERALANDWAKLATIIQADHHAIHRTGALVFSLIYNDTPPAKRITNRVSNFFLGWEPKSQVRQREYCRDLNMFSLETSFARIPYARMDSPMLEDMRLSYIYFAQKGEAPPNMNDFTPKQNMSMAELLCKNEELHRKASLGKKNSSR